PTTAPGDALVYHGPGRTTSTGPGSASITYPGNCTVRYSGIESVSRVITAGAADGKPDVWEMSRNGPATEVRVNRVLVYSADWAAAGALAPQGSTDEDALTIDTRQGNPVPAGGLTFEGGGGGTNRLTVDDRKYTGAATWTVTGSKVVKATG